MSQRVLLHVGTPKTGTSYLQEVLFRNRLGLALAGIHYPAHRFDAHFLAGLDLMQLTWGGLEAQATGAWDALAEKVRSASGTSIVSHEILAHASRAQADRALDSLGLADGAQIHVIVSVRDLVRQIPAEWQENLKHRARLSYAKFLEQIQDPERTSRIGSWFWGVQEIPAILDRWGSRLPADHVHLVTVPQPGNPPHLLWERFSAAFGLDGLDLDLDVARANPSLGVPESALLRRINRAVVGDLPPEDYRPLVRELLVHQTLSRRTTSPRLALPPELRPWAEEISREWVGELEKRGYDVVGSLDDLLPGPDDRPFVDPDRPRERQVAGAAVDAIKVLLLENGRLRQEQERLRHELTETQVALERSYLRPTYRLRHKAVRRLEAHPTGRAALKAYRIARGRSSREA